MRVLAPVLVVALDDEFIVLLGADEAERPRANGRPVEIPTAAVRNNAKRAIDDRLQRKFHITRSQRRSVMKPDIVPQMKDVSQRVRNLPPFGHPRLQIEMLITPDQGIENEFADPFRLSVSAYPGIKVCRT